MKKQASNEREERALKMATAYTAICGAAVPEAVIIAAVRSGDIAKTPAGNIDKKSFAAFLEALGFVGAAASFRKRYGLKQTTRGASILRGVPEAEAEKVEYRDFTMKAGKGKST